MGEDPAPKTNGTTTPPDKPDPPEQKDDNPFPDEPSPGARAKLQKPGRIVITVNPQGMIWIDGRLVPPPEMFQRLGEAAEKGDMQPEIVFFYPKASEMQIGQFQSFEQMMRKLDIREVRHVYGGPGWEGLGPADETAGPEAPPGEGGTLLPLPPAPGGNR